MENFVDVFKRSLAEQILSDRKALRKVFLENSEYPEKTQNALTGYGAEDFTQADNLSDSAAEFKRSFEKDFPVFFNNFYGKMLTSSEEIKKYIRLMGLQKIQSLREEFEKVRPGTFEKMFRVVLEFKDIATIDDRSIQRLLREVDTQMLVKALKGADVDLIEKILHNCSRRASRILLEDMDYMEGVTKECVLEAQDYIVKTAWRLAIRGDVVIPAICRYPFSSGLYDDIPDKDQVVERRRLEGIETNCQMDVMKALSFRFEDLLKLSESDFNYVFENVCRLDFYQALFAVDVKTRKAFLKRFDKEQAHRIKQELEQTGYVVKSMALESQARILRDCYKWFDDDVLDSEKFSLSYENRNKLLKI